MEKKLSPIQEILSKVKWYDRVYVNLRFFIIPDILRKLKLKK